MSLLILWVDLFFFLFVLFCFSRNVVTSKLEPLLDPPECLISWMLMVYLAVLVVMEYPRHLWTWPQLEKGNWYVKSLVCSQQKLISTGGFIQELSMFAAADKSQICGPLAREPILFQPLVFKVTISVYRLQELCLVRI